MSYMNKNQIIEWAEGNRGAISFLMVLELPENETIKTTVITKLEEAKSIRGSNLWVLFSDLCKKDLKNVEKLCKNCPTGVLEDACSREDYSGIVLVFEYL